jgi:hypothetical protein
VLLLVVAVEANNSSSASKEKAEDVMLSRGKGAVESTGGTCSFTMATRKNYDDEEPAKVLFLLLLLF